MRRGLGWVCNFVVSSPWMVFEAMGMSRITQIKEDDPGLSPKEHFFFRVLLREKTEKGTEKLSVI